MRIWWAVLLLPSLGALSISDAPPADDTGPWPTGHAAYGTLDASAVHPPAWTHTDITSYETSDAGAAWPERPVACVNPQATYRFEVVYAVASDGTDRYTAFADSIRSAVRRANGQLQAAAEAQGGHAALRVACDGDIMVRREVLPTPSTRDSFQTIVADLAAAGYDAPGLKVLVMYDTPGICPCVGQAHVRADAAPGPANANNGNGAMFAAVYRPDAAVILHEIGHIMGAVQDTAPHATGEGHCTDGADVMCLSAPGPCPEIAWDCGADDYFALAPAPGSYLAANWNVGSPANRFLSFAPAGLDLACEGALPGSPVTCRVTPHVGGPAAIALDWGDGHVTASGAGSGITVTLQHAYAGVGTFQVRATGTGPAGQATTASPVRAGTGWAPAITPDCPLHAARGGAYVCTVRVDDRDGGMVRLHASWGDGSTVVTRMAAGAEATLRHTYLTEGTREVRLTALAPSGAPEATLAHDVSVAAFWRPTIEHVACTPTAPMRLACTATASDPDENDLDIEWWWGDGTTTRTGPHAPGAPVTAAHDFTVAEPTVFVRAIDRGPLPSSSTWRAYHHDLAAPVVTLMDPSPGVAYVGCAAASPVAGDATFLSRGCVAADVAETGSGVVAYRVEFPGDCDPQPARASSSTAPVWEYVLCGTGTGEVLVWARDAAGAWSDAARVPVTFVHAFGMPAPAPPAPLTV